MPRPCSICTHEQCHEIEKSLIAGGSFRDIALQFGVNHMAVSRHKDNHLPQKIAESAAVPIQEDVTLHDPVSLRTFAAKQQHSKDEQALDLFGEITTHVRRLRRLSDAVDEWLTDPNDPTRYSIDPRAEDVYVIYREEAGEITEGVKAYGPRRKDRLSTLLARLEGKHLEIEATETKHADPRELLGKVSDSAKSQLQFHVAALEKIYNAQETQRFMDTVLQAIGEVAPDVRQRIDDNLRLRLSGGGTPRPPLR